METRGKRIKKLKRRKIRATIQEEREDGKKERKKNKKSKRKREEELEFFARKVWERQRRLIRDENVISLKEAE